MSDASSTWRTISGLAGRTFHTKTGRPFTYDISGNRVVLRHTNRTLPRSHFERALTRSPLTGPGQLQDLQGPSYIYAISHGPPRATARGHGGPRPDTNRAGSPSGAEMTVVTSPAFKPEAGRGTPVSEDTLRRLGFEPHELHFKPGVVPLRGGSGANWNTIGDIPEGPGLYAFTVEDPREANSLRVAYVGLSTHLWMVTKGRLPAGGARGGQRYGRPKHAGDTRQRVNIEVARARATGLLVRHWLKTMTIPETVEPRGFLRQEEEDLIREWRLRDVGWNRG